MPRHKRNRPTKRDIAAHGADSNRFLEWICLALVLCTTLLAYWPAVHGTRLWDDDAHLTSPELQSTSGLYRIWFELNATQQYYPMLHSAFWLEHRLWGDSVVGYHLVNILQHSLAACLVYSILKKLKVPGALLAAAIFALHPVMVESVAWMAEQKNTLSAVFYLSAMRVYLEFDESRRRRYYFFAFTLFVLGLLTKTVTATLPAALLVIFWWQRGTIAWKRDVLPLLPFFALGAVAGAFTAWVERTLIGAEGEAFELSPIQRTLLAGRVIWFYLGKLVWPANLIFMYPRWQVDPAVWWQWLFLIATLAVFAALWMLRKKSRGPLAGWLLFVGTLVPVLGFLNVYPFIFSFVADHFQYLASLGIIVLAAAAIALGIARLPQQRRALGIGAAVLLLGVLAVLTSRQSRMYADAVTLYQTTIERNPACWMAHTNLGATLAGQGDLEAAKKHYQLALQVKPTDHRAHNNLGLLLAKEGRLEEALQESQASVELEPKDAESWNNLGSVLIDLGRGAEAIEAVNRALKLQPRNTNAHTNLGVALMQTGNTAQAIEHFRAALELDPNNTNAHNNLGVALISTGGNVDEAINEFNYAAALDPTRADVRNYLGEVLRQTGRPQQAIEHYRAALELNPNFVHVYTNLAQAYAAVNQPREAIATAERGIEVGRSTGQDSEADKIENWLTQYRSLLP